MTARIEIKMDNAAFDDAPATELWRILRELSERVYEGCGTHPLKDINGNTVGHFTISEP